MLWLIPLLSGTFLMSLSTNLFLVPQKLAEGGVVGVGIILQHKLGIPIWATVAALNIPILALGVQVKGWRLLWRSLAGVGAFSGFLAVTARIPPVTHEPVLAIVYGGLLMGIGIGLVLKSGGTSGGTDVLAIVGHHRLGLSIGTLVMGIDALVLIAAGFAFSPETAMWSAITLVISSKVIDVVQIGFYSAKGVTIITAQAKEIARAIMAEVDRGCTVMSGVGAYTGEPRGILYVVVQRGELETVKRIAHRLDAKAFVVVSEVHEVLGEGFAAHES